ncbi:hypothetical protein PAXRUDRAFT_788858 [Paxillus rubicundulus Ve08.2h10]|uniref:Uncharacterized protein n=1 Tax=Paxillus rubicundulus Ve08.2h10 TaxID=930991 RepID=A0A0D0DN72_9AGAM|nr:hypothetical protein PAXRUDRAFT_788858 [Paxillus rubicundulus Ve08.2h10]
MCCFHQGNLIFFFSSLSSTDEHARPPPIRRRFILRGKQIALTGKRRGSRERSRASKGKHEREETKLASLLSVARQVMVCLSRWTVRIGPVLDFRSCRTLSKHVCSKKRKAGENASSMRADAGGAVTMQVTTKRARRVKARKARKFASKAGLSKDCRRTIPSVTATSGDCLESHLLIAVLLNSSL